MTPVNAEDLRKLLRYEPETGLLWWKKRPVSMFRNGGNGRISNAEIWNGRFADKEALTAVNADGYLTGYVDGRPYRAQRVIWAMMTGAWPEDEVDHEDHDRANNRWVNLREATNAENSKNQSMRSNNTSGFLGVHWHKRDKKWQATIRADGKTKHLGSFKHIDKAITARKAANIKYGFHRLHGVSK